MSTVWIRQMLTGTVHSTTRREIVLDEVVVRPPWKEITEDEARQLCPSLFGEPDPHDDEAVRLIKSALDD